MAQELIKVSASPYGVIRELNLRQLLSNLYSEKKIILGVFIFFVGLGQIYLKLGEPLYIADGTVQVESQSRTAGLGGLDGVSDLFQVQTRIFTEIEIMRSRMVMGRVVDTLNLTLVLQPKILPLVGNWYQRSEPSELRNSWLRRIGGYPGPDEDLDIGQFLVEDGMLGKRFTLTILDKARFELRDWEGKSLFIGNLGQPAVSQGILLDIRNSTAKVGSTFYLTRKHREKAIQNLIDQISLAEKGKYTGIIEIKVTDPDPLTAAAILNDLAQFYVEQNTSRRQEDARNALGFLDKQLPEVRGTLENVEGRLSRFRQKSGAVDAQRESELLLTSIESLQARIAESQQAKSALLLQYTENHPALTAVNEKLVLLDKEMTSQKVRLNRIPRVQESLTRLARDLEIKSTLYGGMVSDTQQLKVAKAGQVGNVRVIDLAPVPLKPTFPMPGFITLASIVAGLLFGLLGAVARLTFRNGIKDAQILEQQTGLPVYAVIPHSNIQAGLTRKIQVHRPIIPLLSAKDMSDMAIESLRSLRTALKFALIGAKSNRVLITGPAPSIGKSFVSSNLAGVLAQGGQRVLLIDADLRKGRLHDVFNLPRGKGLSDLIAGLSDLSGSIHKTSIDSLDLITTGTLPPNPAELLMSPKLPGLLDQLSSQYDLILLDSAPVLAVTDAALIGSHVDITLLVVRYDVTTSRELDITLSRLQQAGVNVKGALLNDVVSHFDAYGYGQHYGYYTKES